MSNLLDIKQLKAWYTTDKQILKGLDLCLEENSVIGLIGLNGAGKTTYEWDLWTARRLRDLGHFL